MTFEDLRVFSAVCEAGSLSAVARALKCTQPAVSQHISRLEKELRVTLLERKATGVTPTDAGQAFRDTASEILAALAAGIHRVQELQGIAVHSLTVTTGSTSVRHFLREAVVRFRRRFPDVSLEFLPANNTARCLELVRAGEADLALVTVDRPQRGVEQKVFARQDLRLLVAEDDPLAGRKRLRISDLNGARFIGLAEHTISGGYIEQALAIHGARIEQVMTVDDFDTACVFVELGLGCAIVPAVQAADFAATARVRSVRMLGLDALPIGIAVRRWNSLSDVAREFIGEFRDDLSRRAKIPGVQLLPERQAGTTRNV